MIRSLNPRFSAFLTIVFWVTQVSPLLAQRQPLEFQVDEGRWTFRTGAPLQVRLNSICTASGPLSGDLRIQIEDGSGSPIGDILLPDQVYSPGRQEFEYLFPLQSHVTQGWFSFTFSFRETNLTTRKLTGNTYVSQGMLVPPRVRSFAMPVACANQDIEHPLDDYEWLTIEAYCPGVNQNSGLAPMVTMHPRLSIDDLPREPLKYLAYDVVVLESSGFAAMGRAQVEALESWVQGGGSLFLRLGREWPADQAEFIQRLLQMQPNCLADEVEGTDLIPVIRDGTYITLSYGWGRVCLSTDRSWSRSAEQDRRKLFADLWRLNLIQQQSVISTGTLSLAPVRQASDQDHTYYEIAVGSQLPGTGNSDLHELHAWQQMLNRSPSTRPSTVIHALLPRDVQTLPFWQLASLVVGYILYIGIGEYFFLGKIHRRRWSWITFPVVTIFLTLMTIGAAKGYLSSKIELNRVIVRDVSESGTVCREQILDLYFHSSPTNLSIPLDSQIYTRVGNQPVNHQGTGYVAPESIDSQVCIFQGNPTGKSISIQNIQQWRPQLNRSVSFPKGQSIAPEIHQLQLGRKEKLDPGEVTQLISRSIPDAEFIGDSFNTGFNPWNYRGSGAPEAGDQELFDICRTVLPGNRQPTGLLTLFDKISPSADIGLFDFVVGLNDEVRCLGIRESGNLVIYRWLSNRTP